MATSDGYQYSPRTGLTAGLPTKARVWPLSCRNLVEQLYDVIVVGAGYAGLVACRDLASRGYNVLLVEARDRIGGRTYTADLEDEKWDIGGTWIHWTMPHVFRELSQYNLVEQLATEPTVNDSHSFTTLRHEGGEVDLSTDEKSLVRTKALVAFFDIDGDMGRLAMPTPHRSFANKSAFSEWDHLSVEARLQQVAAKLTKIEMAYLRAFCISCTGMDLDHVSFLDLLRWWALSGYSADEFDNVIFGYKLKCGQTGLARAIFEDAASYSTFSYIFQAPVCNLTRRDGAAWATTVAGESYSAKHLICTIPWNVLQSITFEPPLPRHKAACFKIVSQANLTKIYAEVTGTERDAWTLLSPSSKLTRGFQYFTSMGCTSAGNAKMVGFSMREAKTRELFPEEDPEGAMAALKSISPQMEVRKLIFHNWTTDPYAKGVASVFRVGEAESSLAVLRESVGRIHFSSSDWAHGWRGFIDGAMEQGLHTSTKIHSQLRKESGRLQKARI